MNTPAKMLPVNGWKIAQSLDLYQVEAWGKGYFSINDAGHVVIRPSMDAAREIDLVEVVQGLKARDLHTPVVIRFSDILAHRLRHLADAFATAIAENEYRNRYAAVFPIKVNQQRLVVEEVYRYGKEFGFGLEVGIQARIARGDVHHRGCPRPHRGVQRLQGRQLHRGRHPRHQARPHHHPGGRELRGNPPDLEARRALRRAAQDRRARQARQRGRRAMARIRGREIQIRPVHQRDSGSACAAQGAQHARLPAAGALPPPAASCRTSAA